MAEGFLKPNALSFEGNVAENWRRFKQRYSIFIVASGYERKSKKEKTCMLLNLAGEQAIEVFNTFTFGDDEEADDPEQVIRKFEEYCIPKRNITYERHVFNTRMQATGETIDNYVTELKLQAKHCEFGSLTNELIRDRIVVGVKEDTVRSRLLRESALTLQKTVDICRAAEVSSSQISALKSSKTSIHGLEKRKGGKSQEYRDENQQALCKYCGLQHMRGKCPAFGKVCSACKKRNHFAKVCRSKPVHTTEHDDFFIGMSNQNEVVGEVTAKDEEWHAVLNIEGTDVNFKLDTGAKCNVIPRKIFEKIGTATPLNKTTTRLFSYGGNRIAVAGEVYLKSKYRNDDYMMQYFVVEQATQPLLGLRACEDLGMLQRVQSLKQEEHYQSKMVAEFQEVFAADNIGCLPAKHHIQLDESVKPVIHAPRRVPVALRSRVKEELDRMEKLGVIRPVNKPTDWVSSMVTVVKPGKLRICLDPRDLNLAIKREHYPTLTVEEVVSRLPNAKVFLKLDAASGFWQIPLDEESSFLTCFNTPFGRYEFKRLPFGIKSAPEIFQRTMHQLFDDIQGCEIIADDILVWGIDEESHDERLRRVMERVQEVGLKLREEKCRFRVRSVTYVGHQLTSDGVKPDTSKVAAILEMPTPKNKQEVQRFMGMIQYLGKFIPNLAEKSKPLRDLMRKDTPWVWNHEQEDAYDELKQACSKPPTLAFYDVNKPVTISVDSCQSGLGAVCMQNDQPIAYASRALTDTQQRHAQIEKELLAIVFGCERFHDFIYGKQVQVETDHKPLEAIFRKSLNESPMRLQSMLLRLQRYDLEVYYKPGSELYIADAFNRAYLDIQPEDQLEEELEVHVVLPMSEERLHQLQEESNADKDIQQLKELIVNGWPKYKSQVSPKIRVYWDFKEEMSINDEIVFKGDKTIIPKSMRLVVLEAVHQPHLGIEASKRRAREVVYWPSMCGDIEEMVKQCAVCNSNQKRQQKEPLKSLPVPSRPWQRIGVDIFDFEQKQYLLTADFYSGWFEIDLLSSLTSSMVIAKLKTHFARYGIPDFVHSDNGLQFSSIEFQNFSRQWGFQHVTSSPRYAQSNGGVERAVQVAKILLKKARQDGKDPYMSMLNHRNTPRDSVLGSPAQRLMSRRTKSILPMTEEQLQPKVLKPADVQKQLSFYKEQQKRNYDVGSKSLPVLKPGDVVRIQDQKGSPKALVVNETEHPRSYIVQSRSGQFRRNRRHLCKVEEPYEQATELEESDVSEDQPSAGETSQYMNLSQPDKQLTCRVTRSGRVVKEPNRLNL